MWYGVLPVLHAHVRIGAVLHRVLRGVRRRGHTGPGRFRSRRASRVRAPTGHRRRPSVPAARPRVQQARVGRRRPRMSRVHAGAAQLAVVPACATRAVDVARLGGPRRDTAPRRPPLAVLPLADRLERRRRSDADRSPGDPACARGCRRAFASGSPGVLQTSWWRPADDDEHGHVTDCRSWRWA